MKRTPLKRKKALSTRKPKQVRRNKPVEKFQIEADRIAHTFFRGAAAKQGRCQHPDCPKPSAPWDPHHVVYEQHVIKAGFPKDDTRNALRLCRDCHFNHHHTGGPARIPLAAIPDAAIEYAREVLGDYAIDYLAAKYRA